MSDVLVFFTGCIQRHAVNLYFNLACRTGDLLSYFFKKITLSRRAGPCSQWSMFVSHTNQV